MTTCKTASKRYAIEFGAAMAAYVAAVFVSATLLKSVTHAIIRPAVALLPMVPAVFVIIAIIRQLRRLDELQRRIQFEALAISFMGTAFITFGYGFLQLVGFPPVSWFAVWPIMAVLWLAGLWFSKRRYAGGDGGDE